MEYFQFIGILGILWGLLLFLFPQKLFCTKLRWAIFIKKGYFSEHVTRIAGVIVIIISVIFFFL